MLGNRYVVSGQPLHGGYGQVFPVHDTFLDREVMCKRLRDGTTDGQLLNEISALASVRSKHVVEIYDVIRSSSGNVEAIIIEKLSGHSYSNFHARVDGSQRLALRALYQISCALSDLHDAGIVHRDLKPDNIQDSSEGVLKLFDFGIASTDPGYITQNNRGTLLYAAPELYQPGVEISKEMDIYAFGVCCWAFCLGSFPPALSSTPPRPSNCPSLSIALGGVNPDIVALLDSCLDEDPALRPAARRLKDGLFRALVSGRHQGRFAHNSEFFDVSGAKPTATVTIPGKGKIWTRYDGYDFVVVQTEGAVEINGAPAHIGRPLPAACVLTFGDFRTGRSFVTFSSSHPELVI